MANLQLPPCCDISSVKALKDVALDCFESGGDLVIDVSAVERLDTSGLQFIAAVARHARSLDRAVTVAGECLALEQAVDVAGLGDEIPLAAHSTEASGVDDV